MSDLSYADAEQAHQRQMREQAEKLKQSYDEQARTTGQDGNTPPLRPPVPYSDTCAIMPAPLSPSPVEAALLALAQVVDSICAKALTLSTRLESVLRDVPGRNAQESRRPVGECVLVNQIGAYIGGLEEVETLIQGLIDRLAL